MFVSNKVHVGEGNMSDFTFVSVNSNLDREGIMDTTTIPSVSFFTHYLGSATWLVRQVAACSMVAVVREGTGMWAELHDDNSVALENNTMADKNNKTEWWSDSVTHNSTDNSAALENSTMEANNKTELWPCDGVTHENSTAEADDLREMTTSSSWIGLSSLIAENRECALETRCATVFAR